MDFVDKLVDTMERLALLALWVGWVYMLIDGLPFLLALLKHSLQELEGMP